MSSKNSGDLRPADAVDSVRVLAVVILGVVGLGLAVAWLPGKRAGLDWAQVLAVEAPFALGPVLYVFFARLLPGDSLRIRAPRLRSVFFVLLASASSMWLLQGLVLLQEWVLVHAGAQEYVKQAGDRLEKVVLETLLRDRVLAFALMSATPALCEEFLFRGVVFRGFERSFSPFRALLYTSVLFAAVHVEPLKMLPMLALGFFFGSLVLLTRSIWSSVIAHAANNAAVLVVSLISHERQVDVGRLAPWYVYPVSAVVFALAMGCLIEDRRECE